MATVAFSQDNFNLRSLCNRHSKYDVYLISARRRLGILLQPAPDDTATATLKTPVPSGSISPTTRSGWTATHAVSGTPFSNSLSRKMAPSCPCSAA